MSSVVLASTQIKTIGAILLLGVTLCNTMHIWWRRFGELRADLVHTALGT